MTDTTTAPADTTTPDHSPDACRTLNGQRCPRCTALFGPKQSAPPVMPVNLPRITANPGPPLRVLMGRYTGPRDMDGQLRMSEQLAKARTALPYKYRENPGDILALMQHAIALDIELTLAWDNLVFNPDGVGGMRARLMHALLIRAGHHVQPVHADDKIVRMFLRRHDGMPSGGAQWTIAEAVRNRLVEKDRSAWVGYPGDMLWARCLSRLARRWAPEVVLGFYAAEELTDIRGDGLDEGLEPADMRTAMRDLDGNLTPAPDVVDLLKDAGEADLAGLRHLWTRAGQEGLMGAYAGTVQDIQLTVRDLLFDLMSAAESKQVQMVGTPVVPVDVNAVAEAATAHGTPAAEGDPRHAGNLADPTFPPDADPVDADDPLDAPAGTGGKLPCGCWAEAVSTAGRHEPDCKRPVDQS